MIRSLCRHRRSFHRSSRDCFSFESCWSCCGKRRNGIFFQYIYPRGDGQVLTTGLTTEKRNFLMSYIFIYLSIIIINYSSLCRHILIRENSSVAAAAVASDVVAAAAADAEQQKYILLLLLIQHTQRHRRSCIPGTLCCFIIALYKPAARNGFPCIIMPGGNPN